MAITKFTTDVENIQGLSDKPNEVDGLTADQLKKKFDDAAIDIKTYLNDTLTEEIDNNLSELNNGWIGANETWTYSSVDNPTGVITITGDKTTKYSLGMRIKFTNGGNVIYGIITKISYSSPNTTLTFLHEIDPTDSQALHLMANSAITLNYYSNMKAPYGFPLDLNKWSVVYSNSIGATQSSPVSGTWYNLGGVSLAIPIGSWEVSYFVDIYTVKGSALFAGAYSTLATSNNSSTNQEFTTRDILPVSDMIKSQQKTNNLTLTNKATFYYLQQTVYTSTTSISITNSSVTLIRAVCAYL